MLTSVGMGVVALCKKYAVGVGGWSGGIGVDFGRRVGFGTDASTRLGVSATGLAAAPTGIKGGAGGGPLPVILRLTQKVSRAFGTKPDWGVGSWMGLGPNGLGMGALYALELLLAELCCVRSAATEPLGLGICFPLPLSSLAL